MSTEASGELNDAIVTTDWKGAFTLASGLCLFLSGKCFLMLNNVVTFLASTVFLTMKYCHMLENGPGLLLSPFPSGLRGASEQGMASSPALTHNGPFPSDPTAACPSTTHGWGCPVPGHHLLCISWSSEPTHAQLGDVFLLERVSFSCSDCLVCASFLFGQTLDAYTSNGKGWTWLKYTV